MFPKLKACLMAVLIAAAAAGPSASPISARQRPAGTTARRFSVQGLDAAGLAFSSSLLKERLSFTRITAWHSIGVRLQRSPGWQRAKDAVFVGSLAAIFVSGMVLDFQIFHAWVLADPRMGILSRVPIAIVAAFVADLAAQWIEMKRSQSHEFHLHVLQGGRVLHLMLTGLFYSVTVEYLVYQWLHDLRMDGASGLWAALLRDLLDALVLSPLLMEPLPYYVYACYVEGAGEAEALAEIRENGLEVFTSVWLIWICTTGIAMLSHSRLLSYIAINVGIVAWNVIFSLKAGEKKTFFLDRWKTYPSLRMLALPLQFIQAFYNHRLFGGYLRLMLKGLGVAYLVYELHLWGLPPPALLSATVFAGSAALLVQLAHPLREPRMPVLPLGASA